MYFVSQAATHVGVAIRLIISAIHNSSSLTRISACDGGIPSPMGVRHACHSPNICLGFNPFGTTEVAVAHVKSGVGVSEILSVAS